MFAKNNHLALGITALLTLVSINAVAAPPAVAASTNAQLEGTWVVTVDLITPPPCLPEEFPALETYCRGGGMITSNNMLQGPGQGSWEKNGNQYAVTILFFTHDAAGAPNGSIRVTHTVNASSRDAY